MCERWQDGAAHCLAALANTGGQAAGTDRPFRTDRPSQGVGSWARIKAFLTSLQTGALPACSVALLSVLLLGSVLHLAQ